jgi:DNA-binding transcriptional regulator of glucitol operon
VFRLAFTLRWIGGLLFCVAAAVVCAGLGRWQWDVAQAHRGTLQNTAYAFNWWLFSALFLGFWFKALRDTVARDARPPQERVAQRQVPTTVRAGRVREPAPQRELVLPSAEEDPEVAEWNAWLRDMNGGANA